MINKKRFLLEGCDDPLYKRLAYHRVRVSEHENRPMCKDDSRVVHKMFMVIAVVRYLKEYPSINFGFEFLNGCGDLIVIFNNDNFKGVAGYRLVFQIIEKMETLSDAPVQKNQAQFGVSSLTLLDNTH